MGLNRTTGPLRPPVEPADVQRQLATTPEQGAHVEDLISAATDAAETYLGRALVRQTWRLTLDGFPCEIELPRPPLLEVSSVRYLDQDGAWQTLAEDAYRVLDGGEIARIQPAYGESWPSPRACDESVEVVYEAGYGDAAADVPATIRQAIVLIVGEWLEAREGYFVANANIRPIGWSARFLLDGQRLGRLLVG